MERQRSFSTKPTRFLVFSFTICSSFLLLFFFVFSSSSFVKIPTPNFQNAVVQFNGSSLIASIKAPKAYGLASASQNSTFLGVKETTSEDTHLRKFGDSSNRSSFHAFSERKEPGDVKNPVFVDTQSSNADNSSEMPSFRPFNESNMAGEAQIPVLEGAQLRYPSNFSGEAISPSFVDRKQAGEAQTSILMNTNIRKSGSSSEEIAAPPGDRPGRKKKRNGCDVFSGIWVFDDSYPLYSHRSCPFIDEGFNCQANGRLDRDYMKWRWQPNDCHVPRFNASNMLELIRGKRVVFAGDSLNRNQWESMLCLLSGAVADPKRMYETHGRRITKEKGMYSFRFADYRCTVEYYASHFLVHEGKTRVGKKRVQTLRLDTIDRSSSRWKGADILIFNTAHWWSHHKTKAGSNYYQEGDKVHHYLDASTAFQKALTTWALWIDQHVNPHKTQVFFRSSAPSHFRGGQWNSGGHCLEATQPLNKTLSGVHPDKNIIVENVVKQMKTPVTILNITGLSEHRIDGHPSVYGKRPGTVASRSIQDCSHWCLPGVPDVWNELLYFLLLSKENKISA